VPAHDVAGPGPQLRGVPVPVVGATEVVGMPPAVGAPVLDGAAMVVPSATAVDGAAMVVPSATAVDGATVPVSRSPDVPASLACDALAVPDRGRARMRPRCGPARRGARRRGGRRRRGQRTPDLTRRLSRQVSPGVLERAPFGADDAGQVGRLHGARQRAGQAERKATQGCAEQPTVIQQDGVTSLGDQ
jgi:hypothetical protein